MASSNDSQRFEMGEFTPSRNHFIPAFTELISHVWNKEIITIFTDLFMVVYQQGTWFDVTHLPTNLTNVDVANAFRKQWPHLKKSLHDAGWDRPHDSGGEEAKRTEI